MRILALGLVVAISGCSAFDSSSDDTDAAIAGVTNLKVSVNGCASSADPLPGWKNCAGTFSFNVATVIQSGRVSVFMNYPDDGAFFHGDIAVSAGSAPGPITIQGVDDYVANCPPATYRTTVDIYDGPQGSTSSTLIASLPVTLTGSCDGG